MAIHFSENHLKRMMKGFEKATETDSMFSHELDMEFSGVYTVHVKNLKTEPLQNYNKDQSIDKGSRYGASKEVQDEEQTFTMTQDKSLNLTIDKGNQEGRFNMPKAGEVMNAETNEQIGPYLDKYRLEKWAKDAGIHMELSAAPTKSNIVSFLINQKNEMLDRDVPDKIQLTIARKYLPMLKLSDEWVGLDSLGGKTLPKGSLGEFDGMAVKPMTNTKMPVYVPWMMTYKGSIIAPTKIKKFKGHVDPPGVNGDLLEFRMIHDAFVIGKKADGVSVAVLPGYVVAEPTIAVEGTQATITCDGATIYYTTDGSDPRYSVEAKTYTGPVTLVDGAQLRAYGAAEGKYNSSVAAYDYNAT